MSKKLLLVFGKSGSGKNYICRAFRLNLVVSHTTRHRRPYEVDGIDYHFISEKTYNNIPRESKIAETIFNGYNYFTLAGELMHKDAYIVEPSGVINTQTYIKKHDWDIKVTVIYIYCNLFKRFYRLLKRGDGIIPTIKRIINDHYHFKKTDYHFKIKT